MNIKLARKVSLPNGVEVKLLIAGLDWVNTTPLDSGAVYVIRSGCQVLHDQDGRLARLVEAIG